MLETIEALMPSPSIGFSTVILIIFTCALIDILSPGVLVVTAYLLLTHPNQLSSRLIVFLLTTQLGYFIIGLLLYFGGDSLLNKIEQLSGFDLMNWLYILLGVVLVLISFSKPKETTKERFISRLAKKMTMKKMILLGIIVFLIEFVTALPYFYSIFLINHISIRLFPSVLILIGYNLIMVLPSLLLLGIHVLFKEKLQQFLMQIKTKLSEAPVSSLLTAVGVIGAVFFNIGLQGILN